MVAKLKPSSFAISRVLMRGLLRTRACRASKFTPSGLPERDSSSKKNSPEENLANHRSHCRLLEVSSPNTTPIWRCASAAEFFYWNSYNKQWRKWVLSSGISTYKEDKQAMKNLLIRKRLQWTLTIANNPCPKYSINIIKIKRSFATLLMEQPNIMLLKKFVRRVKIMIFMHEFIQKEQQLFLKIKITVVHDLLPTICKLSDLDFQVVTSDGDR